MKADPRWTPLTPAPTVMRHPVMAIAWVLLCANILLQIAFPLTGGGTTAMTNASVALFSAAMLCAAGASYGLRGVAGLAVIAGGGGLAAETLGVHTGFPFGTYAYTGALQPELLGVPIAVPAAWIMMSWPAFLVARRLAGRRRWAVIPIGAYALTAWDVFLDPQMVDRGYWRWASDTPGLPGVDGIPLSNFGGWLLVSAIIMCLLYLIIPDRQPTSPPTIAPSSPTQFKHNRFGSPRFEDTQIGNAQIGNTQFGNTQFGNTQFGNTLFGSTTIGVVAYLWTYFSSVIGHLVFFGRPLVALVGGIVMGVVAIPLAASVFDEMRRAR